MGQSPKIRLEQIAKARKLLQQLPEKDDRKTRPEAAELLESDFRKALRKGYDPTELSNILKNEGIIIPAYLIRKYRTTSGDAPRPQKREKAPAIKTASEKTSCGVPDMPEEKV